VLTGEINNTGDPVMVNVPKSYRIGIELIGNAKLTEFLSWSANLTLSRNKIQQYTHYVDNWSYWDDPENEPYQVTTYYENSEISFSPAITGNNTFIFSFFDEMEVHLTTKYVGKQYLDNSTDERYVLDPYCVTDVKINYDLPVKNFFREVRLNLTISNILNAQYETNAWIYRYYYAGKEYRMDGFFPQAGTHVMGGLSLLF
ncbi:MAG: hypothetical protein M0O94_04740, partial [Bacteroidales bacterium]|nr:hypothetical protein [Bacteroidales bacterium]